jgi:thioredoxin reductase (NADPH)
LSAETVDVLVIGAGPAGLSVAAEISYHETGSVLVLEKGPSHSSTVVQYYPDDKRVDAAYKGQEAVCASVLCFRDTTKQNFLATIDHLLEVHRFPIIYDATVDSVRRDDDGLFTVSTTQGQSYRARCVVLAIGRMGRPNRPDFFAEIPPAARKRVHFDVSKIQPQDKVILVVGGGNSAVELALSLAKRARVVLSYRGTEFHRLSPMNASLLAQDEAEGDIRILRASNVAGIAETDGRLRVEFKEGGVEFVDDVVFGIGGSSPAGFLQNAGVEVDASGQPKTNSELETQVPGLWVAGELAVPPGKGSIISSFNSGRIVASSIARRLERPRKPDVVTVAP